VSEFDKTEQFMRTRESEVKGRKCYQEVAETQVTLSQPAAHKIKGQRKLYPGQSITLRLIVSRIREQETREIVSEWYLLTNTDSSLLPASLTALCYYRRWNIETYFKQMKSAGLEMEHWQQTTGSAIMIRLLVASMALILIWQLQRLATPESIDFKDLLVRLSGKTHKHNKPYTTDILLSGVFVLLRIFDFLESCNYDIGKIKEIRNMIRRVIPP
jgi:transposase